MKKFYKILISVIFMASVSFFLFGSNSKRKIIVRTTPGSIINPGSEHVPPRFFCPFELYYDQELEEVEIQLVDEVDYLSYSVETSDGIFIESNYFGFISEGTTLSVSLGTNSSPQYDILLSCNYGVYYATLVLENEVQSSPL